MTEGVSVFMTGYTAAAAPWMGAPLASAANGHDSLRGRACTAGRHLTFPRAVSLFPTSMRDGGSSDQELLHSAAGGEPEAVRALYGRYGSLVYGVALHVVGDPLSAEEITQDVFVKAWQNAARYDPSRSQVSTWLCGMARNRAIDTLREMGRKERNERAAREQFRTDNGRAGGDDPAFAQETSALRDEVKAAVESLPPKQKEALLLAYFQGLTHSQIAERLGEPLGTVKTRIRDAMLTLRGRLGGRI